MIAAIYARNSNRASAEEGQTMMRPRRATVIAALSSLAWAATASAECAWVLGHQGTVGSSNRVTTDPVDSYPTRQACGDAIKAALASAEASRDEGMWVIVDRDQDTVASSVKTKSGKWALVASYSLFCLPDTVDPRGPKGK